MSHARKPPGDLKEQRLSNCVASHVDTMAAKWLVSGRGSYNLAKHIVPKTLILLTPSNKVLGWSKSFFRFFFFFLDVMEKFKRIFWPTQ